MDFTFKSHRPAAGAEARQEALADGAEGPLGRGHDAAHGAVALSEDKLPEADDAGAHRRPTPGLGPFFWG